MDISYLSGFPKELTYSIRHFVKKNVFNILQEHETIWTWIRKWIIIIYNLYPCPQDLSFRFWVTFFSTFSEISFITAAPIDLDLNYLIIFHVIYRHWASDFWKLFRPGCLYSVGLSSPSNSLAPVYFHTYIFLFLRVDSVGCLHMRSETVCKVIIKLANIILHSYNFIIFIWPMYYLGATIV